MESHGGNKYWLLVIDEFTNHAWSFFIRESSDTVEVMMRFIRIQRKSGNMSVNIIRCDNSGENQSFEEEALITTDLNLKFGPLYSRTKWKGRKKVSNIIW